MSSTLNLTEEGEIVSFGPIHYAFIEKKGEFSETARECWTQLHSVRPEIAKNNEITLYFSLFQTEPEKIYSAGVGLTEPAKQLPPGIQYKLFPGGKYARFLLTGPFSNLPAACHRVFEIVKERKIQVRPNDYFAENYLDNPENTPEEKIRTEIMVPIQE